MSDVSQQTELTPEQDNKLFDSANRIYSVGSYLAYGIVAATVAVVLAQYALGHTPPDGLVTAAASGASFIFGKVWATSDNFFNRAVRD